MNSNRFHFASFQVDMVGMLHFWGVTVDTLSCINIVLAIGLCVDYSAHIAHAYIVSQGKSFRQPDRRFHLRTLICCRHAGRKSNQQLGQHGTCHPQWRHHHFPGPSVTGLFPVSRFHHLFQGTLICYLAFV